MKYRYALLCIMFLCGFQFAPASISLHATPGYEVALSYFATDAFVASTSCDAVSVRVDDTYVYFMVETEIAQEFYCQLDIQHASMVYHIPLFITIHENALYEYSFLPEIIWDGFSWYIQYTLRNMGTALVPTFIQLGDSVFETPLVYPNQEIHHTYILDSRPDNTTVHFCAYDCSVYTVIEQVQIREQLQKPFVDIVSVESEELTHIRVFTNQTPLDSTVRIQTNTETLTQRQLLTKSHTKLTYEIHGVIESIHILWQNQIVAEYTRPKQEPIAFSLPSIPRQYYMVFIVFCVFALLVWFKKRKQRVKTSS